MSVLYHDGEELEAVIFFEHPTVPVEDGISRQDRSIYNAYVHVSKAHFTGVETWEKRTSPGNTTVSVGFTIALWGISDEDPPLRMRQRDDGAEGDGVPRVGTSRAQARSIQGSQRVGYARTYA